MEAIGQKNVITALRAREILDSRGFPTVEVDVWTNGPCLDWTYHTRRNESNETASDLMCIIGELSSYHWKRAWWGLSSGENLWHIHQDGCQLHVHQTPQRESFLTILTAVTYNIHKFIITGYNQTTWQNYREIHSTWF